MVPFIAVIFPPQRAIKKTFACKKILDASYLLLRLYKSHTLKHIRYTITRLYKTVVVYRKQILLSFSQSEAYFDIIGQI